MLPRGAATASSSRAPAASAAASPAPILLPVVPNDLLEVEERVARRLLLRFLLVVPVSASEHLLVHDHFDGEHLLVVGTELARDAVLRVRLELALHIFLQHALVVREIRVAQDLVHL